MATGSSGSEINLPKGSHFSKWKSQDLNPGVFYPGTYTSRKWDAGEMVLRLKELFSFALEGLKVQRDL